MDLIPPFLLSKLGFSPFHVTPQRAEMFLVGSILQRITGEYSGILFGTGLIKDEKCNFSKAKFLGVRGQLTKNNLSIKTDIILGDPVLIVKKFIKLKQEKKSILGFVLHFFDKNDNSIHQVYTNFPD